MCKLLLIISVITITNCSYLRDWRYLPQSDNDKKEIYVVSHGWHTGIVVSSKNISPELSFLFPYFDRAEYFEIGWGDKGFYQASEITGDLVIKALLWPTPSVMHVVSLNNSPEKVFPHSNVIRVTISETGHKKLNKIILNSFKKNENGNAIKTDKGLYGDSMFFMGESYFFMTNTCNTWTSEML